VDDEAGVDRDLAGLLGVNGRDEGIKRRHGRCAAAARDDLGAGRGRLHLETAGVLQRLQEAPQVLFAGGLGDDEHGVGRLQDRFAVDANAVAGRVGAAEEVEQLRARGEVGGRASFGRVLVADDEQVHGAFQAW